MQTEVLVVGAGPVGLALAGDLGWRGRQCLVVERGDGVIGQPRMDLVGIRTMEYCRRWGLVADVEASPYNRDYPQDNVYLTTLNGYELERQPMPSMNDEQAPPESPQHRERCPQNMFDPILCKFAASQPTTTLSYRHELVSFEQDSEGVTAKVMDLAAGVEKTVRARFLVGCDGARSVVRTQLGIGMQGRGLLTNTTNVIFRCPEFNRLHDKKPGYRYMFVGPDGIWATIVAINGHDQWRMSIIGNAHERPEYTDEQIKAFAYRALGRPFDLEILSVLRWARMELVADRYHEGRVFICGDACHLTSPTGGLGMNTGIGDAVTLSWKLAAHLEGWGGPALFDAYDNERRPIAKRITAFSTMNLQTMKQVPTSAKLFDDSAEGAEARAMAGRALAEGLKQEWFSMNIHLGNRYTSSPVIVYSEPEDPAAIEAEFNDAIHYRPTSRPGCRAPHAWLEDGRSTLDLFGRQFVLLSFGDHGGQGAAFADAARQAGTPVEHVHIAQADVAALYEKNFVLVRPDGHVAWRGNRIPEDAPALLATVTGHKGS
ncbi:MAG: FAD-dependent oxidoreductase [Pigmentiphaga sp.]|uniref:FAD-dependent oxidoreductase n=1 Tax=Pigmentiphaga sp. TaxID=1977564 RepID=UPI0029A7ED06|nr:FAD-dependent oxidoreductase [Pigmentiphaga sp.]MDX3907631.1 FAD-dependent oxidoreductase [Pigmentiphaga sp.]